MFETMGKKSCLPWHAVTVEILSYIYKWPKFVDKQNRDTVRGVLVRFPRQVNSKSSRVYVEEFLKNNHLKIVSD